MTHLHLIACASGLGGADINSGRGPLKIKNSKYLQDLITHLTWETIQEPQEPQSSAYYAIHLVAETLAKKVSLLTQRHSPFAVLGGDHTCAIGTWSGVYDAIYPGDLGLIWIDAHMDSHTPETTETGNIHGMPLACLLGYGNSELTNILHSGAKIKPENLCLVGVRSFEQGEADLLKKLNVKIYYMDEIKERGLVTVLNEAVNIVSQNTVKYGISFDIDSLDPTEAPGVDVPEEDGLKTKEVTAWLQQLLPDPRCATIEFVEFDPLRDREDKTEKIIISLLELLTKKLIPYGQSSVRT